MKFSRVSAAFLMLWLSPPFCGLANGANKSEVSRFIGSVLKSPNGTSPYESCVRALNAARFLGEGHRFARRSQEEEAFTVRSWHSKGRANSRQKVWVRLTAYGYLYDQKEPDAGRYFLTNSEALNFGLVTEDFDFAGALQETEEAKSAPQTWKKYVEAMKEEVEKTLKSLRLEAKVVVVKNGLGTSPLQRLNIEFTSEESWSRARDIFTSFRGVPVLCVHRVKASKAKADTSVVYPRDPEDEPWVEETPQANLHKLSGALKFEAARLLENPSSHSGWGKRFNVSVRMKEGTAAEGLPLTGQENWSLEEIAEASLSPSIKLIKVRDRITPRNQ